MTIILKRAIRSNSLRNTLLGYCNSVPDRCPSHKLGIHKNSLVAIKLNDWENIIKPFLIEKSKEAYYKYLARESNATLCIIESIENYLKERKKDEFIR